MSAITTFTNGTGFDPRRRENKAMQRARQSLDANLELDGAKLAGVAKLNEFKALVRRDYTENRMRDAGDILQVAANLAGNDPLLQGVMMNFFSAWMRAEERVIRDGF